MEGEYKLNQHIVVFFTDQQRYDSLGCNGNTHAKTENIDNLAREGCNFTRCLAANPVCMPSRASFLTGMYVPGHGVSSNGIPLWRRDNGCSDPNDRIAKAIFGEGVPDKIPTIADYLLAAGYQTALFGKLHAEPSLADKSYGFRSCYERWKEPETENITDPYYGFTYVKNVLGHGEAPCEYDHGHYGRWMHRNHPEIIEKIHNSSENIPNKSIYLSEVPSEIHNSMWIAQEACSYIQTHKDNDKPMFLFVGFPDPHHDFTPPKDIAESFLDIDVPDFAKVENIKGIKPCAVNDFLKKNHADRESIELAYKYTQASVSLIDMAIGKVIDKLKQENLYDDTIIIFTSDHGEMLGDYETLYKTDYPFYSLIHIPFILKPAKGIKTPKIYTKPVSNADILPTLFSMLKMEKPRYVQGINIFHDGKENMPMSTCCNLIGKNRSLSIYDDRYRYTYVVDTQEEELYDQILDPHEYKNLAYISEFRAMCDDMKRKVFEKHLKCENPVFWHYGVW